MFGRVRGHPCVLGDDFSLDQFGLGGLCWEAGGAFSYSSKWLSLGSLNSYFSCSFGSDNTQASLVLPNAFSAFANAIACHAFARSRFSVAKAVNHCHLIGCLRFRVAKAINLQKPFK
jgi:hypothetical protein